MLYLTMQPTNQAPLTQTRRSTSARLRGISIPQAFQLATIAAAELAQARQTVSARASMRTGPFSAREALSRVYGRTTQGFTAGMALAALDYDRHRDGALAILTAEIELNEKYWRIEPGKLPALLEAIGVGTELKGKE